MIINGEKCALRNWRKEDKTDLLTFANNKKIYDNLRDMFPYPYTEKDADHWLNIAISQPKTFFVIEVKGRFAGSIGIEFKNDIYRKNAEIGYWLAEPFWNKGIITESIGLITSYVFKNFEIIRIIAEPFADNTGSRKALVKAGYKCEVVLRNNIIKNNVVKDSCIYSVLKNEWQANK